jgi:hypothetical protein
MKHVNLLRASPITYVEGTTHVMNPTTGMGTVASAKTVTMETHSSNLGAKVRIYTSNKLLKNSK